MEPAHLAIPRPSDLPTAVCRRQHFPLGHAEMLYSAGNQDKRAGVGRYFYPLKKGSEKERMGVCSKKGQQGTGQSGAERRSWLLTCSGWRRAGAGVGWSTPQVFPVAQLLRHQLTVPCLCLFVTKDTVLPTYK